MFRPTREDPSSLSHQEDKGQEETGINFCVTCNDIEITSACKQFIISPCDDTTHRNWVIHNLVCDECKHKKYVIFKQYFGPAS